MRLKLGQEFKHCTYEGSEQFSIIFSNNFENTIILILTHTYYI